MTSSSNSKSTLATFVRSCSIVGTPQSPGLPRDVPMYEDPAAAADALVTDA